MKVNQKYKKEMNSKQKQQQNNEEGRNDEDKMTTRELQRK